MISHKYKCIFIHIQRTAGTSIERWICGENWWITEPSTKHLLASQAKRIYKDYWGDYYKFAFVRNPWDRVVSCLKHPDHFGITYNGKFDFDEYKTRYSYPLTLEYDYRFAKYSDLVSEKHKKNCVYLNILDEELDFIGRFEKLKDHTRYIKKVLGIKEDFNFHEDKSEDRKRYKYYFDEEDKNRVADLHKKDIREFGYKY